MADSTIEEWIASRGIDVQTSNACGLFETDAPHEDVHPSVTYLDGVKGVVIPYFNADGTPLLLPDGTPFNRMRRLGQIPKNPATGKPLYPKYIQGEGTGVHVYLCPLVDWEAVFADPKIDIVITEGEAKAIALCRHGIACIALGGTSSIRNKETREFLPGTAGLRWGGRNVFVTFDSDQLTNPNVRRDIETIRAELSVTRNADVRVVTLPGKPAGFDEHGKPLPDEKVGIDDFILWQGIDALVRLLTSAPTASELDRKVLEINRDVALIDEEEMVYVESSDSLMSLTYFKNGSDWGTRRINYTVMTKKGPSVTEVEVAKEWLRHPNARRFSSLVFKPGEEKYTTDANGRPALNRFQPIPSAPGDVQPFLDLTEFIFSELEPEHRDFALKLMAYKAQNLGEKIPIAIMLVGQKGSGKGMWCTLVGMAFGQYSNLLPAKSLGSDFNGWAEKTLVMQIDEITPELIDKYGSHLKHVIAEPETQLNEKYRRAKKVPNITSFILTSNDPEAASFSKDERRYFVVNTPDRLNGAEGEAFYLRYLKPYIDSKPGPAIMYYLQNYDLQGWRPPITAPITGERDIAYREGLDPIAAMADQMLTADTHTVHMWVEACYRAAVEFLANPPANTPPAVIARYIATKEVLPRFPIRPFYSMSELGILFGHMSEVLRGNRAAKYRNYTPEQISAGLRKHGIKQLRNLEKGVHGFLYNNKREPWLIVADINNERWKNGLTQEEFEREMLQFGDYSSSGRSLEPSRLNR